MRATIATGSAGKFPIRLAAAHLESGDVGELIRVAKWPVIALSAAGMAGVGWIVLTGILSEAKRERLPRTSLARLAKVNSGSRDFLGICQNDIFDFTVDGQDFHVPFDRVCSIKSSGPDRYSFWVLFGVQPGYDIELLDGSRYTSVDPHTTSLAFNSFAGPQTTTLLPKSTESPELTDISGATIQQITTLREDLKRIVESRKAAVVAELGPEFNELWSSRRIP